MENAQPSKEMNIKEISFKNNENSAIQENQNLSIIFNNKDFLKSNLDSNKLDAFSQKLKSKKRKFNFLLKENLSKLANEESEIEKQFNLLSERFKDIKMKKEASDQNLSQLKYQLIQLEDEKKQLMKTEKWAENAFLNSVDQNSSTLARNSIFQTLAELDEIKVKSRTLRSKIFFYQKQLLKLSDKVSPINIQIYLIQAKIDYEKENKLSNQELSTKKQNTIKAAVIRQQLEIEKMKLANQVEKMNQRIIEINEEKNQILKKLEPMRSIEKESILKSILEQVNQYEEASLRRKSYQENEVLTVHDSISKELEIKVEIDEMRNEINDVNKQKEQIKNNLAQKKIEINSLQNTLATFNVEEVSKDPLHDLIIQIKKLRDEENKIAQQVPRQFKIDHSELQKAQQDLEIQYNELKLALQQQLDFNEQMKKEILRRKNNFENKKDQNLNNEVIIPETPKIILLKKRIKDIENEISYSHEKTQKRILKIKKKKEKFENNYKELDLGTNQKFLKAEFAIRFERSMNWFLQTIRSQIKLWFSQSINIPQIVNNWDSKIISAVINETEDFVLKSSIICK